MSPLETVPSGAQAGARFWEQTSLLSSELPHQGSSALWELCEEGRWLLRVPCRKLPSDALMLTHRAVSYGTVCREPLGHTLPASSKAGESWVFRLSPLCPLCGDGLLGESLFLSQPNPEDLQNSKWMEEKDFPRNPSVHQWVGLSHNPNLKGYLNLQGNLCSKNADILSLVCMHTKHMHVYPQRCTHKYITSL